MSLFSLTIWSLFISTSSYFLSPNRYDWNTAQSFCRSYCKSDLASIHSEEDQKSIEEIVENNYAFSEIGNTNVWIGLNNGEWSDETAYDYNNDTSLTGSIALLNGSYEWISQDSSMRSRFLCNHCDELQKYLFVDHTILDSESSQNYCKNIIFSDLASVHSSRDQEECTSIVRYQSNYVHIGLKWNNDEWSWRDETEFDYGSPELLSWPSPPWRSWTKASPWDAYDGKRCAQLDPNSDSNKFLWTDSFCNWQKPFLCQMPSELCNPYTKFARINVTDAGCRDSTRSTELKITGDNLFQIYNKQYVNERKLSVEYTFKFDSFYESKPDDIGASILITDNSTVDTLYLCTATIRALAIGKLVNGNYTHLKADVYGWDWNGKKWNWIPKELELNKFYNLQCYVEPRVDGSIKISASMNGLSQISANDRVGFDSNSDSFSSTIGFSNYKTNITAKYIYISGSPQYNPEDVQNEIVSEDIGVILSATVSSNLTADLIPPSNYTFNTTTISGLDENENGIDPNIKSDGSDDAVVIGLVIGSIIVILFIISFIILACITHKRAKEIEMQRNKIKTKRIPSRSCASSEENHQDNALDVIDIELTHQPGSISMDKEVNVLNSVEDQMDFEVIGDNDETPDGTLGANGESNETIEDDVITSGETFSDEAINDDEFEVIGDGDVAVTTPGTNQNTLT